LKVVKVVDVKCPRCGATFPYSLIAKQFHFTKRKYNRNQILQIIQNFGEITAGELLEQCHIAMESCITQRHLYNIVKALEKEGKVITKQLRAGKYGTTTLIQAINNTDITSTTSPYINHV